MLFWIAGLGRSGTKWLAQTLNLSPTHTVKHEEADPKQGFRPWYYSQFPIERFLSQGQNYGECHGHLIRHLSPEHSCFEKIIPRRAVLVREFKAIVKSWMNRDGHTVDDLPWICRTVAQEQRRLLDYAASDQECRVIHLEDISSDLLQLQRLVDWLELDFLPTKKDLAPVNQTVNGWFDWDEASSRIGKRITRNLLPQGFAGGFQSE